MSRKLGRRTGSLKRGHEMKGRRQMPGSEPITTTPDKITPALLSVVVMPNGEVICLGQTLGRVSTLGPYLRRV